MKYLCLRRHINLDSLHLKLQADYDLKREKFWSNIIAMNSNPLPNAPNHEKHKNQKKRNRKADKVLNLQSLHSKMYFLKKLNININPQ